MGSSEFVIFISILASNIAKGKSEEDINILSTFFFSAWRYSSYYIST